MTREEMKMEIMKQCNLCTQKHTISRIKRFDKLWKEYINGCTKRKKKKGDK